MLRDTNRPGPMVIAGLKQFLADREKERRSIYRRFSRLWESLDRVGAWRELRSALVDDVRAPFITKTDIPDEITLAAVRDLARVFPGGHAHAEHVNKLAGQLFDSLTQVHVLEGRSRFLLGSAALLHDIGCVSGQKGHAGRGAAMILSDDYLPFGIKERGIVALAAAAHRGKVTIRSAGIFSVLSPTDQHRALMIASLLRVADGLDVRHTGVVTSVSCNMAGKQIFCTIASEADAGPERQKAREKADLLTLASGHTIQFS